MGHGKLLLIDDDCWQSSKSLNHDKLLLLLGPITRMPRIPRIVYYDYEDQLMERLRRNTNQLLRTFQWSSKVNAWRATECEKCENKLSIFIAPVKNRCSLLIKWLSECVKDGNCSQEEGEGALQAQWRWGRMMLERSPTITDTTNRWWWWRAKCYSYYLLYRCRRCDMCLSHFRYEIFATSFL